MKVVNNNSENEHPIVNSRYSIVMATAKRARQIITGDHPLVDDAVNKPLSIAIEELYDGKVKIISSDGEEE